ncbi:MAG TPA: DUF6111 family protein [Acetobacteraceae bacterium]|nr:DUF6111 family protein [Acetobacteraceae bacterium]
MLRLTELALFLAPFAAYLLWRAAAGRHAAALSRPGLAALLLVLALLGAGLAWFGLGRRLAPGDYVPARWEKGRIVPGHSAPP